MRCDLFASNSYSLVEMHVTPPEMKCPAASLARQTQPNQTTQRRIITVNALCSFARGNQTRRRRRRCRVALEWFLMLRTTLLLVGSLVGAKSHHNHNFRLDLKCLDPTTRTGAAGLGLGLSRNVNSQVSIIIPPLKARQRLEEMFKGLIGHHRRRHRPCWSWWFCSKFEKQINKFNLFLPRPPTDDGWPRFEFDNFPLVVRRWQLYGIMFLKITKQII